MRPTSSTPSSVSPSGDFERAATALHARDGDQARRLSVAAVSSVNVFQSLGRRGRERKYARLGLKRAEEALRLHPEELQACTIGRHRAGVPRRTRSGERMAGARPGDRSGRQHRPLQCRLHLFAAGRNRPVHRSAGDLLAAVWKRHETMVQERFRSRPHPQPSALSEAARTRRIVRSLGSYSDGGRDPPRGRPSCLVLAHSRSGRRGRRFGREPITDTREHRAASSAGCSWSVRHGRRRGPSHLSAFAPSQTRSRGLRQTHN